MKREEMLAGKNIITYTPRSATRCSINDIKQYLRTFQLHSALRLIGEESYKAFSSSDGLVYNGTSIANNGNLAYLSMLLIENSNDYRSKIMTKSDLSKALDMVLNLPDPFETEEENYQSCLIRFGASQFDYQGVIHHLLPRTLILYEDLWNKTAKPNQIDLNSAIVEISCLTLKELLLFGIIFLEMSKKGYLQPYEEGDGGHILKKYLTDEKTEKFINWISCTYKMFRSKLTSSTALPPNSKYDRFRFNPLMTHPIILPDKNIKPGFFYCVTPIPSLIYERVTVGLYYSLADHFRNGENLKENPFRGSFGNVFEEYIGLLLKETFGENNVKRSWRYGSDSSKETPDWFVVNHGRAILIEVKQSGLYLEAKQWGDLEQIKEGLTKTIGKGVQQMWKFEQALKNESCTIPDWLSNIEITERMVVIHDRSYFLNSILRDIIKSDSSNLEEYHWHTITVEELEDFLGIIGTDFVVSLEEKRLNLEHDRMDFRDFLTAKYTGVRHIKNPYLDSIYDDFLNQVNSELAKQE